MLNLKLKDGTTFSISAYDSTGVTFPVGIAAYASIRAALTMANLSDAEITDEGGGAVHQYAPSKCGESVISEDGESVRANIVALEAWEIRANEQDAAMAEILEIIGG